MTSRMKLVLCAVGFIALMTACELEKDTPTGAPAEPPPIPADAVNDISTDEEPTTTDQILFMSRPPVAGGSWGSSDLYRIGNNGSGLVRLTRNNEHEASPKWSADGKNFVYICGSKSICVSNPDGTETQTIYTSKNGDFVYDPALSPDGSKLAFSAGDVTLMSKDIFIYDLGTGSLTNFTASSQVRDIDPVWHPLGGLAWLRGVRDGDFIDDDVMYAPGGSDEVFVITDAGPTLRFLGDLDVSPDGTGFIFSAIGDTGRDIFLFDTDTDALSKLTQTATLPDDGPSFSPDGSQIVFSRKDQPSDNDNEIYKMNVDGSGVTRLTANDYDDVLPDWGTPVAVVSIADTEGPEGNPGAPETLDFEVTLSAPQTTQVRVSYTISPISASATDLTTTAGTVTFSAGETTKTLSVPITADTETETSESFKVTLSNPVGAVLGDGEARGLIVNDDAAPSPSPSPSPSASASPTPVPTGPGQIAFTSTRNGGNFDIWVMAEDGSGARALLNDDVSDGGPDLSPDGSTVVFQRGSGPPDIYTVPVAGGTPTKVNGTAEASDVTPAYNPAGTGIIWASADESSSSLLTATPPTGAPSEVVDEPGYDTYPSWGTLPSGDQVVAFHVYDPDSDSYELRLKNLTSGTVTDLGEGRQPEISPDGSKLVYASILHGDLDIYVRSLTNLSATAAHLTTDSADDATPSWSPDGTQIAFTAHRDGNSEIYVMNVNGSSQTNITNNPAEDFEPSWGVGSSTSPMPAVDSDASSPEPTPEPSYGALVPLFAGLSLAARRKWRARRDG
jgi:Tol biopolymer transport system component